MCLVSQSQHNENQPQKPRFLTIFKSYKVKNLILIPPPLFHSNGQRVSLNNQSLLNLPFQQRIPNKSQYRPTSMYERQTEEVFFDHKKISFQKLIGRDFNKKQTFISLKEVENYLQKMRKGKITLTFCQFFKTIQKFRQSLDPIYKQYINLNKQWCINFFTKLQKNLLNHERLQNQSLNMRQSQSQKSSNNYDEIICQSQSVSGQSSVSNYSQCHNKQKKNNKPIKKQLGKKKNNSKKLRQNKKKKLQATEEIDIDQIGKIGLVNHADKLQISQYRSFSHGDIDKKQIGQPQFNEEKREQQKILNLISGQIVPQISQVSYVYELEEGEIDPRAPQINQVSYVYELEYELQEGEIDPRAPQINQVSYVYELEEGEIDPRAPQIEVQQNEMSNKKMNESE